MPALEARRRQSFSRIFRDYRAISAASAPARGSVFS
jgi:hypothetical protein